MSKTALTSFVLLLLLAGAGTTANAQSDAVSRILAGATPPDGVVFEIVSDETGLLKEALPLVKNEIKRLRKRFPKLDIAVVSHGDEQFALTQDNRRKYKKVHRDIKSLSRDAGVPVHVCGGYARMKGVSIDEFPEYVDVAANGPSEIRTYEELGYQKIEVTDSWLNDSP